MLHSNIFALVLIFSVYHLIIWSISLKGYFWMEKRLMSSHSSENAFHVGSEAIVLRVELFMVTRWRGKSFQTALTKPGVFKPKYKYKQMCLLLPLMSSFKKTSFFKKLGNLKYFLIIKLPVFQYSVIKMFDLSRFLLSILYDMWWNSLLWNLASHYCHSYKDRLLEDGAACSSRPPV